MTGLDVPLAGPRDSQVKEPAAYNANADHQPYRTDGNASPIYRLTKLYVVRRRTGSYVRITGRAPHHRDRPRLHHLPLTRP